MEDREAENLMAESIFVAKLMAKGCTQDWLICIKIERKRESVMGSSGILGEKETVQTRIWDCHWDWRRGGHLRKLN